MRRGQATTEYILLIGIAAAGLIAVIFYVSRGHQGQLRSQADQLSERQYAPGKTVINNHENKTLNSSYYYSSGTTTIASQKPQGQINPELQGDSDSTDPYLQAGLLGQIGWGYGDLFVLMNHWEEIVVDEALDQAGIVRSGTPWPWLTYRTQPLETYKLTTLYIPLETIPYFKQELEELKTDAANSEADWDDREPDTSSSWLTTNEVGDITTDKTTNEVLDNLLD